MHRVDSRVLTVARAQHGAFHSDQLDESPGWLLAQRVRSGRWIRHEHCVYSIAGSPDTWHQQLWIRLLKAGRGAVVGRCAAARLYRLHWFGDDRLDIVQPEDTVTRAKPRSSRRTSRLPTDHCTVWNGFPVTTVARTIYDLAGLSSRQRVRRGWPYVPAAQVERILDDALVSKRTTLSEITLVFGDLAGRGRPGTTLMRSLIQARSGDFVPTESELEDRFVKFLEAGDLPMPRRQVVLGDETGIAGRVDFLFETERVIVELDGHRFHAQRQVRHADLQRDLRLSAAGWRTIRLDWWQLVEDAPSVAHHLRALLTSGG